MYMPTFALLSISALFTTTFALPQAHCFAGLCFENVRPGHPDYDDWADEFTGKNKNHHLHDRAEPAVPVEAATPNDVANPMTTDYPTDNPTPETFAGVYICEDVAWGGQCTHTLSPLGSDPSDCTVIPHDRASSIGPDAGFYCIFYTNAFCAPILSDGSDSFGLAYPGSDNLGFTEKGDFNDRLLSYQCFRDDDSLHLDPETGLRKVDGTMQ